jgi:hydrogenase-4 component E
MLPLLAASTAAAASTTAAASTAAAEAAHVTGPSFLEPPLLVLILLLNLFVLGTSRLRAVIGTSALQGVALGVLTVAKHAEITFEIVAVAVGAVAIKGIVIPRLLHKAMRDAAIEREVAPLIGFIGSILVGAIGTALAVIFSSTLPLRETDVNSLILPSSFATVLTGFIILTTRRKAITQVVGYIVLENGVFIFGMLLLDAMPFMVEVGVLLDVFVAVFVMGIVVDHIRNEFSSLDTEQLSALKG